MVIKKKTSLLSRLEVVRTTIDFTQIKVASFFGQTHTQTNEQTNKQTNKQTNQTKL